MVSFKFGQCVSEAISFVHAVMYNVLPKKVEFLRIPDWALTQCAAIEIAMVVPELPEVVQKRGWRKDIAVVAEREVKFYFTSYAYPRPRHLATVHLKKAVIDDPDISVLQGGKLGWLVTRFDWVKDHTRTDVEWCYMWYSVDFSHRPWSIGRQSPRGEKMYDLFYGRVA